MSAHDDREQAPEWLDQEEAGIATEEELEARVPKRYKVLLLNDDYTTMEFVVMVLMNVFHHAEAQAVEIMLAVHHEGIGVAGVYPFEVAETKVGKVHELARQNEFPLRCALEPE